MAYHDTYRLSSHGVILNEMGQVLLLKASYGNHAWGLPGGALDAGETIHDALIRECAEELGCEIEIQYLSGVYYHSQHESQAFIFKCKIKKGATITLSDEHLEFKFFDIDELSDVQKRRVQECLGFDGYVQSARF
ncbi:NUDIX hydrolase [Paraglaciecola sp. 2405UD69-4]|uniref:NUDIX hydrolase n=1 Tax=Paraglaciecola sp. 2405UD69-4 TaxID=3391836 RepID=UPI0039C96168